LLTVAGSTRRPAATRLFENPSAHASTILARSGTPGRGKPNLLRH